MPEVTADLQRRNFYDLFEDNDVKYAIRLKINSTLLKLAQDEDESLMKATRFNMIDYAATYGE